MLTSFRATCGRVLVLVSVLAKRPREQYRFLLLAGLRHPWAPAAQNAAET